MLCSYAIQDFVLSDGKDNVLPAIVVCKKKFLKCRKRQVVFHFEFRVYYLLIFFLVFIFNVFLEKKKKKMMGKDNEKSVCVFDIVCRVAFGSGKM